MITMTQYSIRVSAENALGEGEPSGKQTVKTLPEAPEGGSIMMRMMTMIDHDHDHADMYDAHI